MMQIKEQIERVFQELEDSGYVKSSEKKGKEHTLIYTRGNATCEISWTGQKQNPSLTYSDESNLFGILDCEESIRSRFKGLPENQNELLAWIVSAMPLEDYLTVFKDKINSL